VGNICTDKSTCLGMVYFPSIFILCLSLLPLVIYMYNYHCAYLSCELFFKIMMSPLEIAKKHGCRRGFPWNS
jgi:hypothetical protein